MEEVPLLLAKKLEPIQRDILAEIETDKATWTWILLFGSITSIGIQEGESAPVDAVLVIGPEGTDVARFASAIEAPVISAIENRASEAAIFEKTAAASSPVQDKKVSSLAIGTSSPNGRIIASPLAKKIAEKDQFIPYSRDRWSRMNCCKDIESYQPSGTVAIYQPQEWNKSPNWLIVKCGKQLPNAYPHQNFLHLTII